MNDVLTDKQIEKHRKDLLKNISELEREGIPGGISVFGEQTFAVLTGQNVEKPEAVIAASIVGKGRCVAIGHNGYLNASNLKDEKNSKFQLIQNIIRWLSQKQNNNNDNSYNDNKKTNILVVGFDSALAEALSKLNFKCCSANDLKQTPTTNDFDVIVWRQCRELSHEKLISLVESGVGCLMAMCPWGWQQITRHSNPSATIRDHMIENRVMHRFGMAFTDSYVAATSDNNCFSIAHSRPNQAHAIKALDELLDDQTTTTTSRVHLIEKMIRFLPHTHPTFELVSARLASLERHVAPTPSTPVKHADAIDRLIVILNWLKSDQQRVNPDQVKALPGVDAFPGTVDNSVERVSSEVFLIPSIQGWQSFGVYAAPGDVIRLVVTEGSLRGWRMQIGAHTDELWHKPEWKRYPSITTSTALSESETRLASPFGGTIYFEAMDGNAGMASVQINNVIRAPRFVRGSGWLSDRSMPAPWAELEGHHIILTVPSSIIRELEDASKVLEFWDSVVENHCELGQTPIPERKERFVCDVQISAGYMHAGYPVMMHLDVVEMRADGSLPALINIDERMKDNAWGYFHELGHNRQRPWWTFSGTGEVTCNLFTLYSHEKIQKIEPWSHEWLAPHKKNCHRYLESPDFDGKWRKDPGLALISYVQIQKQFGWQCFKKVFAHMEQMNSKPSDDQEKIDCFVRLLSLATKKDLRPFWQRWGMPLGAQLLSDNELNQLKVWHAESFRELMKTM